MIQFNETLPTAERWRVSRQINALCPEHWAKVRLGEIAEIQNGFPFESKWFNRHDGKPLIRIRDVGAKDTETYYSGSYQQEFVVHPGDILIGMDGEFRCARWQGRPALLNQRVCRVKFVSHHVDPAFVFSILQPYLTAVESVTSSITVRHLSSRTVEDLEIPLPPLNEQQRIAEELREIEKRTGCVRRTLLDVATKVVVLRESVLAAAFRGDLTAGGRAHEVNEIAERNTVPDETVSWVLSPMSELVEPQRSITYGIVQTGTHNPSGIPTVRCGDIKQFRVEVSGLKRVEASVEAQYPRTRLRGGEVLIAIRGTVGATAAVDSSLVGMNVSREVAIIPVAEHIAPRFVMYFLASPEGQRAVQGWIKGVAQSGINLSDLRAVPVPVPSFDEQQEVVRRIEIGLSSADRIRTALSRSLEDVERLSASVLTEALRGKLVPQDPNDESASALLERIRAEKAGEGSAKPRRGRRSA